MPVAQIGARSTSVGKLEYNWYVTFVCAVAAFSGTIRNLNQIIINHSLKETMPSWTYSHFIYKSDIEYGFEIDNVFIIRQPTIVGVYI